MSDLLKLLLIAAAAYLLGSLNGSIMLSRFLLKDDIRRHGSGNAGATNVLRTYGKKWTILVSVWDMGKGALAIGFARLLSVGFGWGTASPPEVFFDSVIWLFDEWAYVTAGFFVILGHVFPAFFGFKGGKGVFTACMVMLILDWQAACIALTFFLLLVIFTRYVSLGAIVAVFTLPLSMLLLGDRPAAPIIMSALTAVLVIFLHRANIGRLLTRTEHKIGKQNIDQEKKDN